jgi:hypothetical protein
LDNLDAAAAAQIKGKKPPGENFMIKDLGTGKKNVRFWAFKT